MTVCYDKIKHTEGGSQQTLRMGMQGASGYKKIMHKLTPNKSSSSTTTKVHRCGGGIGGREQKKGVKREALYILI